MDDFADDGVRVINNKCSAQSCKTVTNMALQGWTIVEDPAPTLWVTKSAPEAKKLVKGRLWPMYDKTPCIAEKLPKDKGKRNLLELYFPGYYLIVAGAENEASLQSTPFRYLFLDEVRQWREGALEMVRKRTRRYPHNHKHLTISCPDMEGDPVDRAFNVGNRNYWEKKCRNTACDHWFRLEWGEKDKPGGIKWDTNEVTRPEGRWNYDEVLKTLHFECAACKMRYTDVRPSGTDRKYFGREWTDVPEGAEVRPGDRWWSEKGTKEHPGHWQPNAQAEWSIVPPDVQIQRKTGRWTSTNPNAASDTKSYTWNALLPHFTSWEDQVKEFLSACAAMEWGDFAPLKDHWNETRGLSWSDRLRHKKEQDYLDQRVRDYKPGDLWPEAKKRFMTVDVQAKGGRHFWVLICDWAHGAVSRRIHYQKAWSWAEVWKIRETFNVPMNCVAIDEAFASSEVKLEIVKTGYQAKAFRGEDKTFFQWADGIKRIWDHTPVDPVMGKEGAGRMRPIKLYRFAKPAMMDQLALMLYGELGDFQIYKEIDEKDYKLQVTAWDRRYRTDRHGQEIGEWYQKRTDDHAHACERMQIVCATISGMFREPGGANTTPSFEEAQSW